MCYCHSMFWNNVFNFTNYKLQRYLEIVLVFVQFHDGIILTSINIFLRLTLVFDSCKTKQIYLVRENHTITLNPNQNHVYLYINAVHVGRKAIEHAPERRDVKEGHRRAHDSVEEAVVERDGRTDAPQVQNDTKDEHRQACKRHGMEGNHLFKRRHFKRFLWQN